MAGMLPRRLTDDEPLSATWLNALVAFVDANQILIDPHSGLTGSVGPGGVTIGVQDTPDSWIQLSHSGGDGSYSWVEVVPASGGGWSQGFRKGWHSSDPARSAPPDPAWESSKSSAVPLLTYVQASRDAAVGRLSFRAGLCS